MLRLTHTEEEECRKAGVSPQKVENLARDLEALARRADRLGVIIFGGSCGGQLRFNDGTNRALILASVNGPFDGGCGSIFRDDEGLMRGE